MKNRYSLLLIIAAVLLASCSSYDVYPVKSKPTTAVHGGLLYALPRTQVKISVTFEKHDYANAPYAQYAAEMLGLDQLDIDAPYAIRSIAIEGVNTADPDYYYFVHPRNLSVEVDSRHLLRSVGMQQSPAKSTTTAGTSTLLNTPVAQQEPQYNLYDRADTFYVRGDQPGHPSLVASKKDHRNMRQRAQDAAEQIGELQEKRQQLLYGDYEGAYTPEAIQYLLGKLQQREAELLAQFTGEVSQETVDFYIDPQDEKKMIDDLTTLVFCFSPTFGLYDTIYPEVGDLEAFYCNIHCENHLRQAARFVKYRTASKTKGGNAANRNSFKYRQSEEATVTVSNDHYGFSRTVRIAQFGPIIDLPRRKFKAQFDEHTSDLIYYGN